ncbi:uncharacterized protein PV06_11932 [Exophiala oligosperma]|uniref:Uncharacterized protein n=1 Tax=Exophiala oligosperma TaxID=215243 RepID=A0A0D2BDZ5_9EURO|nr:uncharacterized protein PV06_11932 [Exophiala oligosperma]KIW35727.1 hypothetical protein PV06_11932 [Exophiala oligosperma]
MEIHASATQWYGIIAAIITVAWQVFRLLRVILRVWLLPWSEICIKWLAATLMRTLQWTTIDEFDLLFVAGYVTANAVCISLNAKDSVEVAARCGNLATINLVPLLVGLHLSDVADFLGMTLRIPKIIHRWVSCVMLLEVIVHVVINALTTDLKWTPAEISGTIQRVLLLSLCGTISRFANLRLASTY